jgi:peptide-methionine (S)-S-oxide reductase
VRTRVGYAGGTTPDPTYDDIGDHSETIRIEYDPAKITYGELLEVFWKSHNPAARSWSTQYRAVIFPEDEDQRRDAEKSAAEVRSVLGGRVFTAIEPGAKFYPAEGYHQKYYLRQDYILMRDFNGMYGDLQGFIDSPAAAKVNGYLAGLGSETALRELLPSLGLSEEGEKRLLTRVR